MPSTWRIERCWIVEPCACASDCVLLSCATRDITPLDRKEQDRRLSGRRDEQEDYAEHLEAHFAWQELESDYDLAQQDAP